jgi:hypothetical protein
MAIFMIVMSDSWFVMGDNKRAATSHSFLRRSLPAGYAEAARDSLPSFAGRTVRTFCVVASSRSW